MLTSLVSTCRALAVGVPSLLWGGTGWGDSKTSKGRESPTPRPSPQGGGESGCDSWLRACLVGLRRNLVGRSARKCHPWMTALHVDRLCGSRERRIGERAYGDRNGLRLPLRRPEDGGAARGAELEGDGLAAV